tara:strand:- start:343 stop:540 length:198 start_codon:yes stop_codon:yes gene_type:complete
MGTQTETTTFGEISTMNSFTVMYYESSEDASPREFYCSADSVDDAREQCEDENPHCQILYTSLTQ